MNNNNQNMPYDIMASLVNANSGLKQSDKMRGDVMAALVNSMQMESSRGKRASGGGDGMEVIKFLMDSFSKSGPSQNKSGENFSESYKKGASKAIKEIEKQDEELGKQHIQEAYQEGVPVDELKKHSVMTGKEDNSGGGKVVPAWSMFGMGGINKEGNVEEPGALAKVFSMTYGGKLPQSNVADVELARTQKTNVELQSKKIQQQIEGKEPLQSGERERIEINNAADFTKALTLEAIKMNKEGMLKPDELFKMYENTSKVFIETNNAMARIEAAVENPSAAGDVALIYGYMRMLDPQSTVREGEFATAQNSGSIPEKVRAFYNKAVNGQRLSSDMRNDFFSRAKVIHGSIQNQHKKSVEEFKKLGKENGIAPEKFMRNLNIVSSDITPGQARAELERRKKGKK